MKLILLCLCIIFFVFWCLSQSHIKNEKQDTTSVGNTIDLWIDSLNTRKFSEDNEILKENVKEFGIKSKKYIDGFISKMKKLFKEIVDYLKR